tara:strand:- start:1430 stop:2032 length:603 start_codon:yes stop_codon:yes gene_type:complete
MKKTIKIFLTLLIIGVQFMSCDKPTKDVAVISTKFGDMVVEFFPEVAPMHVESFIMHSKNGYYNGTTFHRVIPGFVIQGGDPNSKNDDRSKHGVGGHAAKFYGVGNEKDSSSWMLPSEFNSIDHTLGVLSMARAQDPNSAGSQFFICAADAPMLNNNYTVFGKVTEGQPIINQIVNVKRDGRDNPLEKVEMTIRMEKREK